MALLVTLVLGTPAWIYGLRADATSRAARGNGAWLAWTLLWVAVAGAVLLWARRSRQPQGGQLLRSLLELTTFGMGVWFACVIGIGALAGDFGVGNQIDAMMLGLGLLLAGLVILAVAHELHCSAPRPVRVPTAPGALGVALTPLLLPAVVLGLVTVSEVPRDWQGRIAGNGLAGLMFLQLETVAPLAAPAVALALDRRFGTTIKALRPVVAVSSGLLVLVAMMPITVDPPSLFSVAPAHPGQRDALSFTWMNRSVGLLVIACAGLTMNWLSRPRRPKDPPLVGLVTLALAPPVWLLLVDLPDPAALPVAGCVGCIAAAVASKPRSPQPAPSTEDRH